MRPWHARSEAVGAIGNGGGVDRGGGGSDFPLLVGAIEIVPTLFSTVTCLCKGVDFSVKVSKLSVTLM
ncbi:hypothetical protein IAD21_04329 [Abditibacteriota bacterium]|nr:hypothetical protein IAD21_04329 [Abditibacteriota bacterium]